MLKRAAALCLLAAAAAAAALTASSAAAQGECEPADFGTLPLGVRTVISGTLAEGDCESGWYPGSHLDRHVFELPQAANVTVTVSSAAFDPFLFVRGEYGVVASDDDSGLAYDAQATANIQAGEWQAHVTSTRLDAVGDYTITVLAEPSVALLLDTCHTVHQGELRDGFSVDGALAQGDCTSRLRENSYADRYEFTLAEPRTVQIDLRSRPNDSYLHLFDATGVVVARNDDDGGALDSRIAKLLPAGTYLIEATTVAPNDVGGYTLEVRPIADEVQVIARRLSRGGWEIGVRTAGGIEILPSARFVSDGIPRNRWQASSPAVLDGVDFGRVRINVRDDGSVLLGFRRADGAVYTPAQRTLPADAPLDVWVSSSVLRLQLEPEDQ